MNNVNSAEFGPVTVYFGEKGGRYPDGNQIIVRGRSATVAFDTPLVANRLGAVLDSVDFVILGHVHEDHVAGLHRIPRAEVHVHQADLPAAQSWEGMCLHYGYPLAILNDLRGKFEAEFFYQPRPDAVGYVDGAVWDLGGVQVRAVHMPGHTAGHCVLLVEPHGIAFIGDIDLSSFGPYYGDRNSSLGDFRRSLARLPDLPASVWITYHHKGVVTDRDEFVEALGAFEARLDEREARLLQMLADGPRTVHDLVQERLVYPRQFREPWVECVEQRFIEQHLEELMAAGRLVCGDDGRFVAARS